MPLPPLPAAICVPVRDEEETLPLLLEALARQHVDGLAPVCCFHLDGCADASEAMLRAAARNFPFPLALSVGDRLPIPNAGRARRAAMALGLERIGEGAGILLSTDADSAPAPDWVAAACRALKSADVAVGTLIRSEPHPMQARVEAYYDRLHRYRRTIDPVAWEDTGGRHFAGGANLAITAAAYRALGGFAERPSGEDAALLDDASRAGYRVRHDPAMMVETSARRHGRAPGGLADALADLDRCGAPQVAHPAAAAWQYRAQARARAAFAAIGDEARRSQLGASMGLTGDHVLGVARDCPNAEAFAMRIVPAAPFGDQPVPLAEAEGALAVLEAELVEVAA